MVPRVGEGRGLWHTSQQQQFSRSLNTLGAPGGEVLTIMAYTGRLRPKEVPFSGFRYMKG